MAAEAPKVPPRAAAIVSNVAAVARQTFDPPHGGLRADAAAPRSGDER
jgi:hypothetical protein